MFYGFRFADGIVIDEVVDVFDLSLFKGFIFNIAILETIYPLAITNINNKGLLLSIKKAR